MTREAAASGTRSRPSSRDNILTCFTELVAERGYDQVSLRDVAEQLEISKGTILHHFTSKELLLERLHHRYMARRLAEANIILTRLNEPAEMLSGMIYQLFIAQRDDRAATVAFAREIQRFSREESMKEVRAMREDYAGLMTSIIQQGIDAGDFAPEDTRLVTLQVFGMCNWSWTWYRPEGHFSAEHIARTFIRTLLHGLACDSHLDDDQLDDIASVVHQTMREYKGLPA